MNVEGGSGTLPNYRCEGYVFSSWFLRFAMGWEVEFEVFSLCPNTMAGRCNLRIGENHVKCECFSPNGRLVNSGPMSYQCASFGKGVFFPSFRDLWQDLPQRRFNGSARHRVVMLSDSFFDQMPQVPWRWVRHAFLTEEHGIPPRCPPRT